jgi:hypothetical protein
MLQPKWILFYFLFFGVAALVGHMLDGVWAASELKDPSAISAIATAVSYDYSWLSGNLVFIRWILVSVQIIGGLLIAYEFVSGFFGRR